MSVGDHYKVTTDKLRQHILDNPGTTLGQAMKWLNNQKLNLPWAVASTTYHEVQKDRRAGDKVANPFNPPRIVVKPQPPTPPPSTTAPVVASSGTSTVPVTGDGTLPSTALVPWDILFQEKSKVSHRDTAVRTPEQRATMLRWAEDFMLAHPEASDASCWHHMRHYFGFAVSRSALLPIVHEVKKAAGLPLRLRRPPGENPAGKPYKRRMAALAAAKARAENKEAKQKAANTKEEIVDASIEQIAKAMKQLCQLNQWASVAFMFNAVTGELEYKATPKVVSTAGKVKV